MMSGNKGNEFNFLLLNRVSSWEKGLRVNLQVTENGLSLQEILAYGADQSLNLEELQKGLELGDFAAGSCGQLYLLDTSSPSLLILDSYGGRVERIECISPLLLSPTSIAFGPGTLFVACRRGEERILAFARINSQLRWTFGFSREIQDGGWKVEKFTPLRLAADGQGNLYALTPETVEERASGAVIPEGKKLVVVRINRAGQVAALITHEDLAVREEKSLDRLEKEVWISLSGEGILYLLDSSSRDVWQFAPDGRVNFRFHIDEKITLEPQCLAVDGNGDLYVGDGRPKPLATEDDRFLQRFKSSGEYLGPVSGFRGRVDRLAIDETDTIWIFNSEENKIAILKKKAGYSGLEGKPLPTGLYVSRSFDGLDQGTFWHRIVAPADLPPDTQVRISCVISDDREFFIDGKITNLDDFIETDPREPEEKIALLDPLGWAVLPANPVDALIRGPAGRFLWLKIELTGTEEKSPRVESLSLYFPRSSYLRYLPAVYQENEESRDFLERFLSIFESSLGDQERRIAHLARYFDAGAVSGDFLRWLASWLALSVDENWGEERLRALVRRAPELYRMRGTRQGIETIVELFTGLKPMIVEWFQLNCVGEGRSETDLWSRPGPRRYLAELDCLLYLERALPAEAFGDEEIEVRLVTRAKQDLKKIEIRERFLDVEKTFTREKVPAGTILEDVYRIPAVGKEVLITGSAGITPAVGKAREFATPTSRVGLRPTLRELLLRLYGADPYCFCVLLNPVREEEDGGRFTLKPLQDYERGAVRRILDQEKPAPTCAGLQVLQPRILLDMHSYLGMNSCLSQPSLRLDTGAVMPHDTVLTDVQEAGQVERRSRVNVDTTLT